MARKKPMKRLRRKLTPYYVGESGTLYCGDCLDILPRLEQRGFVADMVLTDLPYGTTRNVWDAFLPLEPLWVRIHAVTKENAALVFTAQIPFTAVLGGSNLEHLRYKWIWQKNRPTGFLNAKKAPLKVHEDILIFYRKPPTYNPQMRHGFKPYCSVARRSKKSSSNYGRQRDYVTQSDGSRYPIDTLRFKGDRTKLHPTQKPLSLFGYMIATYTDAADMILDPCAGAGTTAVAAERLGRRWVCIEKEEKYCGVIRNRLELEKRRCREKSE